MLALGMLNFVTYTLVTKTQNEKKAKLAAFAKQRTDEKSVSSR